MASRSYEIDMCRGPLLGKILRFSFPLMLSSILQLLFNAADVITVGQFAGKEAMAAVGSTASLYNLIINVFVGLATGSSVLMARFYGSRDERNCQEIVHTSVLLAIICGIALIFIGIMIYTIGIRNIRLDKDLTLVFLGRFVICPLVCLGLTRAFELSPLYMSVYVIQASLPCITQIAVLAKFHHADTKFATTAVAGTTLASVVTLPVWMMILTALV